jgi:hypothetical protein
VYWHPQEGFWVLFDDKPERDRYWICYGSQDPAWHTGLTITVETNPPFRWTNRRTAGAFAVDAQTGHRHILHSGRVGGGRKGIGQKAYRQFDNETERCALRWPEKNLLIEMLLVGDIDESGTATRIGAFVRMVDKFKVMAASS